MALSREVPIRPRIVHGSPPEWLVYDSESDCPYLAAETARLPLRMPVRQLERDELERRLAEGDRRQGSLLYRPSCPSCQACEAIRINVGTFEPTRSQRRAWRRGREAFAVDLGRPTVDAERAALYNLHKTGRQLQSDGDLIDEAGYASFLVDTCADTIELSLRYEGKLAGVAIVDRASDSLSAVYTYFDPSLSKLSPGVFAIMLQTELCRNWGLTWLYLGLYVQDCAAMEYKLLYLPHERLQDGVWRPHPTRG